MKDSNNTIRLILFMFVLISGDDYVFVQALGYLRGYRDECALYVRTRSFICDILLNSLAMKLVQI